MVDGSVGKAVQIDVPLGDKGLYQFCRRGIFSRVYIAIDSLCPHGETAPLRLGVRNPPRSPGVAEMEWTPRRPSIACIWTSS